MSRILKLFAYFVLASFLPAAGVYLALRAFMPYGYVFAAPYRMFLYHWEHPFQYITLVALTYASLATPCALQWSGVNGVRRSALILGLMAATILAASVPGGMLWKIHDMQAGFFTAGARFWSDLGEGAMWGLKTGWLIIAWSVPYNIFGVVIGYFVTSCGLERAAVAFSSPSS